MYHHSKKITTIIISILIIIVVSRLSGVLRDYKITTTSLEPNLKLNTTVLVSNLITPKYGDFVAYNHSDSILKNYKQIFRLIGKSKDTIEIREGVVLRNGKNIDKNLNLAHKYKISSSEFKKLRRLNEIIVDYYVLESLNEMANYRDSIIVNLRDEIAKKEGFNNSQLIQSKTYVDKDIYKQFGENWNKDNFGPLVIPKDKLFVLGDNRDNSYDSRSIGLINKSDVLGVVIINW